MRENRGRRATLLLVKSMEKCEESGLQHLKNPPVYGNRYVYIVAYGTGETLTPHLNKVNVVYISAEREIKCWEKGIGGGKSTDEDRTT